MPAISVVIPVFNAASFIEETIDSVRCQTFRDFELLLADDGSTDNSAEIIQSYNDPRIRYIPCVHDFTRTVNRGYNEAKGKYIAQLDHDDLMMPDRLQVQYEFMEENQGIAACGGWMHCFGKYNHVIRVPLEHDQIMLNMLLHGPILNPTGFVRKQFLTEHQIKHQSAYSFYADYKFWFEVAKAGKLANIPKILTRYRTSDDQATEKYLPRLRDIARKIKLEVLAYLCSQLKDDNRQIAIVKQKLIPVMIQLKERDVFSDETFFPFVYEMMGGVMKINN